MNLKEIKMSISKIRTLLYKSAKYLGDFSAINRAVKQKSFSPIFNRLLNRIKGKLISKIVF